MSLFRHSFVSLSHHSLITSLILSIIQSFLAPKVAAQLAPPSLRAVWPTSDRHHQTAAEAWLGNVYWMMRPRAVSEQYIKIMCGRTK
jgi:hypothetical protein